MSDARNWFTETLEIMRPGDCLIVASGTLPGKDSEAKITVDLTGIIPLIDVIRTFNGRQRREDLPAEELPYGNPLKPEEPKIEVMLGRTEGHFAFDSEDQWLRVGKGIGTISGQTVDIVLVSEGLGPDICFIAKPSE